MTTMPPDPNVPAAFTRFGELLRFLRLRARLTQRDLSIAVGYNFAHLSRLEQGQRAPDPAVVAAVFVPALDLIEEPAWAARLIELAHAAHAEHVVARRFAKSTALAAGDAEEPSTHQPLPAAAPVPSEPRHTLPAQLTPLVGRDTDLAVIQRLLDQPDCRVLTIVGPGGIGKTRLALGVAAALLEAFPDGVCFVPLAPLPSAAPIAGAIADSLGLQLLGAAEPEAQIVSYLHSRRVLLVLDNFEHVLDSANFLAALLTAAPGVRALVTSRERLNLSAETIYRLDGLSYPRSSAQLDAIEHGAVQLLMQAARMARPHLEPQEYDLEQMVRICGLVAGMPLALVMAASWLEVLPFRSIADEIAASLDFLETELRDVPERQRSVRAVFDASWNRLAPEARLVFMKLSVFRGGWTRQAAQDIAGANLRTLQMLANTSFIVVEQEGRYTVHELLRQYGAEQLAVSGAADAVQDEHSAYFLRQMSQHTGDLKGGRQLATLAQIDADLDNIRSAWQRAIERRNAAALEEAAEGFCLYHEMRGALLDGEAAFARAAATLGPPSPHPPANEHGALPGVLLVCQGMLCTHRGNLEEGRTLLEDGLAILRHSRQGSGSHAAFALLWLGWTLFLQGNTAQAEAIVQESLQLYTAQGDRWGIAKNLFILGNSLTARGKLTEAEPSLRECLAICRAIADHRGSLLSNRNLAILTFWFGDYAQTRALLDEAIQLSDQFNDRIGMAYLLREYGKLEVAEGQYDEALQTLQHSIAITDDIGSRWESAATLDDLGVALSLNGDLAAAQQILEQCLAAARAVNNQYYTARCLGDLGSLALERGQYAEAEEQLRAALDLWAAMGHEPYQAWIYRQLGRLIAVTGDAPLAAAREPYRQGLHLAVRHRLAPFVMDVLVDVAELLVPVGEESEPVRLLSLAEQHSASTFATKARARQLLEERAVAADRRDRSDGTAISGALDWREAAARITLALASPQE